MNNTSTSLGYKGRGASSGDVTALRRKLAEARTYDQTDKKRGIVRATDIVLFKPVYNVYSQISGSPVRAPTSGPVSSFRIIPITLGVTYTHTVNTVDLNSILPIPAPRPPWSSGDYVVYSFTPSVSQTYTLASTSITADTNQEAEMRYSSFFVPTESNIGDVWDLAHLTRVSLTATSNNPDFYFPATGTFYFIALGYCAVSPIILTPQTFTLTVTVT